MGFLSFFRTFPTFPTFELNGHARWDFLSFGLSRLSDYFCTMADVHSKATRSYNMSRIRSKDTKPEMLVRRFLHKNGFRYRLHVKGLPGKSG